MRGGPPPGLPRGRRKAGMPQEETKFQNSQFQPVTLSYKVDNIGESIIPYLFNLGFGALNFLPWRKGV